METFVLLLILLAAVMHASWNALIKSGGNPWLRMGIVMGSGSIICLFSIPFVPFPRAEIWPYIIGSTVLHQIYFTGVCLGYRVGDLSHVYPIQRGLAPILVAVGAWFFAGETLSTQGIIGVSLICIAIFSLALGSTKLPEDTAPLLCALFTGTTIACYTIVDGLGGRLTENVYSYIFWLFLLSGIPYGILALWIIRKQPSTSNRNHLIKGVLGGALSMAAYGLAIWAMTIVPMTYVSALRETSVIAAAFIGTFVLKEPFGAKRITSAVFVALGVFILQTGAAV